MYLSVFNGATVNNCTFNSGTQTVSFSGSEMGGLCATEARYTYTAGTAGFLEQFTSASITGSTYETQHDRAACVLRRGQSRRC